MSSALGTVASCSAKLEYRAKKLDDAFGELDRAKRAARDEGIDMKEFRSDFQVCMRMFLADQAVRKVLNHVGAESAGLSTESSLSDNLKAILRNVETTLTEAVDAGSEALLPAPIVDVAAEPTRRPRGAPQCERHRNLLPRAAASRAPSVALLSPMQ